MAALSDYLLDLRRLLHDANATYWSDTDLTAFINRSMQQRDLDTGMNRSLVTFALTTGQSTYNVVTVSPSAFDVVGISLLYSNLRIDLEQKSYRELIQKGMISIQNYNDVPTAWAKYGTGKVIIGVPPNSNYSTEWDTLQVSPALVANTDTDPLPFPWTDPVPFMAARFAKMELQEYEEADKYAKLYQDRVQLVLGGARGMVVGTPYFAGTGR